MPPRRGWGIFGLGFYKDVAPTALGNFSAARFWPGAIHGTFFGKINHQDIKARRKNVRLAIFRQQRIIAL
jgi:hypothetical protein